MVVACKAAAVPPGEGKRIEIPGHAPIAIFNVDGKFYAIDDTCTHGNASLCEGFLDGRVIECPFHSGSFDVVTGEALAYPATAPVTAYGVRMEGGDIVLDLD